MNQLFIHFLKLVIANLSLYCRLKKVKFFQKAFNKVDIKMVIFTKVDISCVLKKTFSKRFT